YQIRILDALYVFHLRAAEYQTAYDLARQIAAIIPAVPDPDVMQSADWMLGVASHFLGNHPEVRAHSSAALTRAPLSRYANVVRVGGEPRLPCAMRNRKNSVVRGSTGTGTLVQSRDRRGSGGDRTRSVAVYRAHVGDPGVSLDG